MSGTLEVQRCVVVDTPLRHLADTELVLAHIDDTDVADGTFVCTHMVTSGTRGPHYAFSITPCESVLPALAGFDVYASGDLDASTLPSEIAAVAAQLATGEGGRAVRFPGQGDVRGDVTVECLIDRSAIGRVHVLGGGALAPDTVVETRDFLRPLWKQGVLTLPVLPAGPGRVAPFEVPNPTPCCGEDH